MATFADMKRIWAALVYLATGLLTAIACALGLSLFYGEFLTANG